MKNKTIIGIALLLTSLTALAQDATNAPPVPAGTGSFFQTATAYFSSFNQAPEMGWIQKGELAAGVVSLQGPVNLANNLRLAYEIKSSLGLEASTRSSGIAGTWLSQQFGPNYSFNRWDAKLTLYGNAGYNFFERDHAYYGEMGLRVSKKMTAFTYAFVGMGVQVPTGRQVYEAGAGFTF